MPIAESAPAKTIVLKSSDGDVFNVEKSVAIQCESIKQQIENDCADSTTIPLPNVSSKILAKVIEYCKSHAQDAASGSASTSGEELKNFDTEFVSVDKVTLFGLIAAAKYLDVKQLFDLTCKAAADMINKKTPEEIREFFNIKNDLTPEEEEEIRRENAWALEPVPVLLSRGRLED